MCDFGDLDPCVIWEEAPAIARKWHRCDGCASLIAPGDAYLRHASLYDGNWTREAECFACWWIREDFGEAHRMRPLPSQLSYDLVECGADQPDSEWRPHLASFRRRNRRACRVLDRTAGALTARALLGAA